MLAFLFWKSNLLNGLKEMKVEADVLEGHTLSCQRLPVSVSMCKIVCKRLCFYFFNLDDFYFLLPKCSD